MVWFKSWAILSCLMFNRLKQSQKYYIFVCFNYVFFFCTGPNALELLHDWETRLDIALNAAQGERLSS